MRSRELRVGVARRALRRKRDRRNHTIGVVVEVNCVELAARNDVEGRVAAPPHWRRQRVDALNEAVDAADRLSLRATQQTVPGTKAPVGALDAEINCVADLRTRVLRGTVSDEHARQHAKKKRAKKPCGCC